MLGLRLSKIGGTALGGEFYLTGDGKIHRVPKELTMHGVDVVVAKRGWELRYDDRSNRWMGFKSQASRHAFGGQSIRA